MRHLSIAFIEDDPADLDALEFYLKKIGTDYDRTVATDGEQAVACLSQDGPRFDLIFMNMRLPKLNTPEVLRRVAGSEKLPICILTGSPEDRKLLKDHFASGAVSFLMKPVDREKLIDCFRCHEHLRSLADELASTSKPE